MMMPDDRERPIIIPTYKRVWKVPRILHRIDRFKLIRPVTYWQILYFFVGILLSGILNQFFFYSWLPGIGKFGVFPFGLAWYLSKAKHDGKSPHRWLMTYVRYLMMPKIYNRYRPIRVSRKERYSGVSTFRDLYEIETEQS